MGLFNYLKKETAEPEGIWVTPYKDSSVNLIYNLLFCDNIQLFKKKQSEPYAYPFNILLSATSSVAALQQIIDDKNTEPRIKMLACNKLLAGGHIAVKKELFAVIVEVALNDGLDVLAAFNDGTARYINQSEKVLVWETTSDETANKITAALFTHSQNIVAQIGVWDKPRLPAPSTGNVRITFLVSDGLYFGEGPIDVLFTDPIARDALQKATGLMEHITGKAGEQKK